MKRQRCCYWFTVPWCLSLGISICFQSPNVEIHLPFGFFKIGWELYDPDAPLCAPVE